MASAALSEFGYLLLSPVFYFTFGKMIGVDGRVGADFPGVVVSRAAICCPAAGWLGESGLG